MWGGVCVTGEGEKQSRKGSRRGKDGGGGKEENEEGEMEEGTKGMGYTTKPQLARITLITLIQL